MFFKSLLSASLSKKDDKLTPQAVNDDLANEIFKMYTQFCLQWINAKGNPNAIKKRSLFQKNQDISKINLNDMKFDGAQSVFDARILFFLQSEWIKINNDKSVLKNLTITLPLKRIKEIFDKYGVIQLRELNTGDKLLIGCGNMPCDQHKHTADHAHPGYDTVDLSLSMNPSVIGVFGADPGLVFVLPKAHYTTLATECCDLDYVANTDAVLTSCMKNGYQGVRLEEPYELQFGEEPELPPSDTPKNQ